MTYQQRYNAAHEANFQEQYPSAYREGHYSPPNMPKVNKSNGLTTFCINYLTWVGQYGNRINTMGRLTEGVERQASGTLLGVKKWIPSSTRKGTADIHGVYNGRHLSIEVKIGRDIMSQNQHKEADRIRRAGGLYFVVTCPDDFFRQLDAVAQETLF